MKIELRQQEMSLESDNDGLVVRGYVNKSDQLSEVLGSSKKFREKISRGVFKNALENRTDDIDFLGEHDSKMILSSTRNDSLTLTEDEEGLFMEARITPTSWGKDYHELISSGILRNMSFGFRAIKDSWKKLKDNIYERTIEELELFEVSVVKNPAYSASTISARGIDLVEDVEIPNDEDLENKNEQTKRGNDQMTMKKMEQRTNEFEDILKGTENRALTTTADGGSVIPENVHDQIILKMEESSSVFKRARKLHSVSGNLKVPRENPEAIAGFVGEGQNVLEQSVNFEYEELTQKRVGAAISLSNQLINDSSINIADYAKNLLARRTVKAIEKSMLTGTEETEFRGIVHALNVTEVKAEAGIVDMDLLQELYLSVVPDFLENSVYIMSREFFNKIAKLKDNTGHYFMQNGMINGKLTYTLFGLPVEVTDTLPETTPVVFGNIEEAVTMLVKKESGLQQIANDTTNALRGSQLFVYDLYADSVVTNPQAIAKLTVPPVLP